MKRGREIAGCVLKMNNFGKSSLHSRLFDFVLERRSAAPMDCGEIIEKCEIALIELTYAMADYSQLKCGDADEPGIDTVDRRFPALRAARAAAILALEAMHSLATVATADQRRAG